MPKATFDSPKILIVIPAVRAIKNVKKQIDGYCDPCWGFEVTMSNFYTPITLKYASKIAATNQRNKLIDMIDNFYIS